MLQSIRDNITGWIAWVVVILLSIPFALFGINSYFEGRFSDAVAQVEGEEIGNRDFQNRYQNQYQQVQQMFGEQFDPDMIDESQLRRQVLDQMIQEELLIHRAEDQRLRVSEQEVVQQIRSVEAFHEGGQFSMERYRALLRAQNMSPSELERNIERDLLGQRIQNALVNSSFVTGHEVERMAALENQRREFEELRVSLETFRDQVAVSEEEVADYYQANQDRFMTPEAVDLDYVKLSLEDVRDRMEISEDEVRAAWEQSQEEYMEDERRLSRHILLSVGEDEEAVREEIEALRERIRDGESFEELASEYSEDSVSADDGGSLGWVYQDDMVESVDEAIFELETGEVSEPIRSEFGYHLVRVDEIDTPEPLPYEEVRDEIRADLQEQEAERYYFELREEMGEAAYANPDELNVLADLLDLEIRTVEGVTRDEGQGIAENPQVRQEAFSDMVLGDRMNSDPIELDEDTLVVIRVGVHHEPEQRPLEDVADEVRSLLRDEKARNEVRSLAESLKEELDADADLQTLLDRDDTPTDALRYSERQWVSRNHEGLDSQLGQRLFRMALPDNGPRHEMIERGDGDWSLIALHSVDTDSVELAEDERRSRADDARSQLSNLEFMTYVQELRRVSDVEVMFDADDEEELFEQ
ncbi:peptidyl-prolyl cis-trans isomerase D [Natronospira proteinivora]|uniref:Periplasmic chaperone PpiD n=1 Tax=Natronospira proteinivora TaxID=1807133 RepID=A0ABT1G6Z9_9GAMM|nr:SurA N-terminal domain-containing protein [Natronospira proteinivora]MCP1727079.1 peptidyl-prolyl cis-trans isomerase D [Natronospira proteinivora]